MIGITKRAQKELKELLLTGNAGQTETCVRLRTNQEGKLGLGMDVAKPDDKSIEYEGLKLLVVEPKLADSLENVAIDIVDSEEGKQFVIIKIPQ